jgi:hypothetical protein
MIEEGYLSLTKDLKDLRDSMDPEDSETRRPRKYSISDRKSKSFRDYGCLSLDFSLGLRANPETTAGWSGDPAPIG